MKPNPLAIYSAALSGQRNMIITSSIALLLEGVSIRFKDKHTARMIKLLSVLIFVISISLGLMSDYNFRFYLDREKDKLPSYIPVDNWYRMSYFVYAYIFIITLIGGVFFVLKVL